MFLSGGGKKIVCNASFHESTFLPSCHTHTPPTEGLLKVFFNSDFSFSRRLYGSLDVDLPRILLCQPLSKLVQQSVFYVHNSLPHPCFRALMHLSELSLVSEMADIIRNDLLPSAQEVAALSLQFAVPAGLEEINGGWRGIQPRTWSSLDLHVYVHVHVHVGPSASLWW